MLHDAHIGAAQNLVWLLVLQKHSDHRGLGHKGVDSGHHLQIAGIAHHVLGKARAVVVVDLQNPGTNLGRAPGGGKYRQISPLGMSRHPYGCLGTLRRPTDVLLRQPLGGNGLLEGHIEVLLPANQGIVRAPVDHEHGAVVQQEGHGRELGLLFRKEPVFVHAEPGLAKAEGSRGGTKQIHILFHPHPVLRILKGKELRRALPQSHRLPWLRLRLVPIEYIGQGRKNQRVHRIGSILGKGQVAPPGQIVKHIRHGSNLLFLL